MKTYNIIFRIILTVVYVILLTVMAFSQERKSIAVVSIDTKDLEIDNEAMSSLVRLELEKNNQFEVLDKYDVNDLIKLNNIDPDNCFGKSKVVQVGKLLDTDKMLTGSAEKFGEKIVMIFRLVDVRTEKIEKTSVMEYLNVQREIQTMVLISLNELLGIPNDPHLVDLLIDYNLPITSMKTSVSLNGPRMGATYTSGEVGKRMQDHKADGGYDMFPVTSMFGYQFEWQYLSSGSFQALLELLPTINGLESGQFIPSLTFMNGFRFNGSGIEFGLGPSFRVIKTAKGFYDDTGKWNLYQLVGEDAAAGYEIIERLDHRGDFKPSVGMIIAFGKTFKSGYLNMPVNVYFSPRKNGSFVGLTFGFNTTKKPDL